MGKLENDLTVSSHFFIEKSGGKMGDDQLDIYDSFNGK